MIGEEVVSFYVDGVLATLAAVTSAVGSRRFALDVVPAPENLPACLYHAVGESTYGGGIGGPPTEEMLDFAIRFAVEGGDTSAISPAAWATLAAFGADFSTGSVVLDGVTYGVAMVPTGRWPGPSTYDVDNRLYRSLGSIYRSHVTVGG